MASHLPGSGTSRVLQRLSPELQGSLLQTMHGMAELITALTGLLQGQAITTPAAAQRAAEPWRERMQPAPEPSASEDQVMGQGAARAARLAHLRGDLAAQLPAGKDGTGYQVSPDLLLNRRSGRRQWRYSLSCRELECQLKARQAYEQQSGEATYSLGAAFWELRSSKG